MAGPTRVEIVQNNLREYLRGAIPAAAPLSPGAPLRSGSGLTAARAQEIFRYQALSRRLDIAARALKESGRSFYTISSAGHEQNAIVGELLRTTDPCFLHYRSGALMMARLAKDPDADPIHETVLSFCAAADDPVSGGRHKVWGSRRTWVPPQTSTIGSHLPKAMGLAFSLTRARRVRVSSGLPNDTIVCCSFGDASLNHATSLAGINSARYAFRRGHPTPVLFVCEDNKRGISVDTPSQWVEDMMSTSSHIHYFHALGEMDDVFDTCDLAIRTCRATRGPVFLHVPCVRLWGHAGSDVETAYLDLADIERAEADDPLLRNAQRMVSTGAATPQQMLDILDRVDREVLDAIARAEGAEVLTTRAQVVGPLAPFDEVRTRIEAQRVADAALREEQFEGALPENATSPRKRTLAAQINAALIDEMVRYPEIVLFGEDVGKKGGVYGVTTTLQRRFGPARVFDTLLDETTILGVAQGAAQIGLLPIPEIQYLAYVHNALDQIRGEACSLSFFSNTQFTNPMVIRIASFGYQRGFGGHFHNDNSIGALRDIPGLIIASPARGDDAVAMLRGCVATARENGRVVAFLEPIALYHQRDLHEAGDGGWLSNYPAPGEAALPGELRCYEPAATDLLIATYGNGLWLSLRAAKTLREEHGIGARVVDLRWLNPLPFDELSDHVDSCGKFLVVDECRATGGGVAEAVLAWHVERGGETPAASVRAADSYVPLGTAANLVLVSEEDIVRGALDLEARG